MNIKYTHELNKHVLYFTNISVYEDWFSSLSNTNWY